MKWLVKSVQWWGFIRFLQCTQWHQLTSVRWSMPGMPPFCGSGSTAAIPHLLLCVRQNSPPVDTKQWWATDVCQFSMHSLWYRLVIALYICASINIPNMNTFVVVSSAPSLVWVCNQWSYQTCIPMRSTLFKSTVLPKRISGSGETGATNFPSGLALLVGFTLSRVISEDWYFIN